MTNDLSWVSLDRAFDAPIERVWALWTEASLFQKWYGPMGMTVPEAQMDLTIGGARRITMEMETPDRTMRMFFTGEFKEISPMTRLVYTEAMCDADGNIISPESMGMPPGTPEITEVIVELSDLGQRTRVKLIHMGVPSGSPGAQGWTQALDKLAALLAKP